MFREALAEEFLPYARLSQEQLDRLERHYKLLRRWNRTLNLTRIEQEVEAIRFHYCESLFLGLQLPSGPLRIADVGSGAGFPGFPVAVLRHDFQVTLIESHRRKAVFLREAVEGVPNLAVFEGRALDFRQAGDWVISRAVSPKEVLATHLAHDFALLVAREDALADSEIIQLPWGHDRVICMRST